jgi:CheY-like chemotaxis protein
MSRILVVEDDGNVSYLLQRVLEGDGHEVLVADDGSRGLAMATRRRPDAIVMDIMMPFMDGFAVLEALREDERTASDPRTDALGDDNRSRSRALLRLGSAGVHP